jgi:hypothetical protein
VGPTWQIFVRCDREIATDYSFTCLSAIHVSVVVVVWGGQKLEFLSRAQSDWVRWGRVRQKWVGWRRVGQERVGREKSCSGPSSF